MISSPHGLGALSSPSSASPILASIPADSVSADSPSSADSPMLEAASSSSSPAGLQLMVDLSSYQLPQVSSLPPSSSASPPYDFQTAAAQDSKPGCFRCRHLCLHTGTALILLLLSPLYFLMLTGMQFGIMLCVMRSLLCAQIALGLWFCFILL